MRVNVGVVVVAVLLELLLKDACDEEEEGEENRRKCLGSVWVCVCVKVCRIKFSGDKITKYREIVVRTLYHFADGKRRFLHFVQERETKRKNREQWSKNGQGSNSREEVVIIVCEGEGALPLWAFVIKDYSFFIIRIRGMFRWWKRNEEMKKGEKKWKMRWGDVIWRRRRKNGEQRWINVKV